MTQEQAVVSNALTPILQGVVDHDVRVLDSYLGQLFMLMKYADDRIGSIEAVLATAGVDVDEQTIELVEKLRLTEQTMTELRQLWTADRGVMLTPDTH